MAEKKIEKTNIFISFAVSDQFSTGEKATVAINSRDALLPFFRLRTRMNTCSLVLDTNTDTEIKYCFFFPHKAQFASCFD